MKKFKIKEWKKYLWEKLAKIKLDNAIVIFVKADIDIAILKSDKINFMADIISRDEESHHIKVLIHQENIILNL